MTCLKNKKTISLFGILLFSFCLCSSVLFSPDTSAISNLTYSYKASNFPVQQEIVLCDNSSSIIDHCDNRKFVLFTITDYENSNDLINTVNNFRFNYKFLSRPNNIFNDTYYTSYKPLILFNYMEDLTYLSIIYRPSSNQFSTSANTKINILISENNPFSNGVIPTGSLNITENGTYDVTNYAQVIANVPAGDYSDDINDVKKAILLIPAVLLVLYFFFLIYRIIIIHTRRF